MKWEAESIKRLTMTSTPRTGSYYPRFTRDGGVIAANTDITPDGVIRSNLIQFTPDQIDRLDTADVRNQKSVISLDSIQCTDLKFSAIGSLFSMVCEALPLQDELKDTVLIASSVDYNSCSNLIEDFFTDHWIQNMNVSSELKSLTRKFQKKIYSPLVLRLVELSPKNERSDKSPHQMKTNQAMNYLKKAVIIATTPESPVKVLPYLILTEILIP